MRLTAMAGPAFCMLWLAYPQPSRGRFEEARDPDTFVPVSVGVALGR